MVFSMNGAKFSTQFFLPQNHRNITWRNVPGVLFISTSKFEAAGSVFDAFVARSHRLANTRYPDIKHFDRMPFLRRNIKPGYNPAKTFSELRCKIDYILHPYFVRCPLYLPGCFKMVPGDQK
jgi:hypothetical protein